MAKRMVDTELWNNEDIIEMFTAEDRYFWLYLLTNPHNSICGVMKASPVLIARDMGYSKECVQNLLYRFENVHKAIYVDKETKELIILNWSKFNWTKSPKLLQTIKDSMSKILSSHIKIVLQSKIDTLFEPDKEEKDDTVSIPYRYPTNTNTITDTNKERKKERNSYINIINQYTDDDDTIEAIWKFIQHYQARQGRYILNDELVNFLEWLETHGLLFAGGVLGCLNDDGIAKTLLNE